MTRYSQIHSKKGIDIFGKQSVAEILKEYRQIHDMNVIGDMDSSTLSTLHNKDNLNAINVIKENRIVKNKGRI